MEYGSVTDFIEVLQYLVAIHNFWGYRYMQRFTDHLSTPLVLKPRLLLSSAGSLCFNFSCSQLTRGTRRLSRTYHYVRLLNSLLLLLNCQNLIIFRQTVRRLVSSVFMPPTETRDKFFFNFYGYYI